MLQSIKDHGSVPDEKFHRVTSDGRLSPTFYKRLLEGVLSHFAHFRKIFLEERVGSDHWVPQISPVLVEVCGVRWLAL
jgi:hypothetical protein